jgi:ribose transport system permease protein
VLAGTKGAVYGGVPQWLTQFVSPVGKMGGIPVPPIAVFWAVFAVVIGVVLHLTGLGRKLFATGANERAAQLALVRTELVSGRSSSSC